MSPSVLSASANLAERDRKARFQNSCPCECCPTETHGGPRRAGRREGTTLAARSCMIMCVFRAERQGPEDHSLRILKERVKRVGKFSFRSMAAVATAGLRRLVETDLSPPFGLCGNTGRVLPVRASKSNMACGGWGPPSAKQGRETCLRRPRQPVSRRSWIGSFNPCRIGNACFDFGPGFIFRFG